MIPVVEDYLSDLLQSKLDYLKANPGYISKVLGIGPDRAKRIDDYLKATPIRVTKGYPRTPAELPAVVILLSGEQESQITLGDIAEGEESYETAGFEELLEVVNRPGSKAPYSYVESSKKPLESVDRIVVDGIGDLDESEYWISNHDLGIVAIPSLQDGDRVTMYSTHRTTSTNSSEYLYECNYRIESWTNNGDLTVWLYHLVKWALLSGRDSFIEKGIFRQKLGGADFEPAPAYMPEFVYRRALSFWCQLNATLPMEDSTYIEGVFLEQHIELREEV